MAGRRWNGRRRKNPFRRFRWERLLIAVASALLIAFGVLKLFDYRADYVSSRQTAGALRQAYGEKTPAPVVPVHTPPPATEAPITAAPAPSPSAVPRLNAAAYPDNPRLQISSRFKALRKENKDIVGWLSLGGLLEEAIVQRDESFYMDHDALGKKNVNGAIFLDSGISLTTRPYALILYGHNMKTGAMFGCLRNYENLSYYHSNPFVTFDTLYETGRYVIFAVGTVNTVERVKNYVDFFALRSTSVQERQQAIDALARASVFSIAVDVRPDDQLLLLVTCVDHDNERRVVAARRLRPDEKEADVRLSAERSWKKP